MADKLGELGVNLFISQVLFGVLAYYLAATTAGEGSSFPSFTFALFVAGVVAAIVVVFGAIKKDTVRVVLGTSSCGAVFVVICVLIPLWIVAAIMAFFTLSSAIVAALIVGREGEAEATTESFSLLFLSALPLVGPILYLLRRRSHVKNELTTGG